MTNKPPNSFAPTRRTVLASVLAGVSLPKWASAAAPLEISWDDLIPPGVDYARIIGEGDMDVENDTWAPIYDENGFKLNDALNEAFIRMPGFILPIDYAAAGVRSFVLVPYVGACIHVPPPPANQLVFVTAEKPWPLKDMWEPVWVTGTLTTTLTTTQVAETGYALAAEHMEVYVW